MPDPDPAPALYDYAEGAHYLNVSERFLRLLVAQEAIDHHRLGRLVRFSRADLDGYLAACKVTARP